MVSEDEGGERDSEEPVVEPSLAEMVGEILSDEPAAELANV